MIMFCSRGGIKVTVTGRNLDSVAHPVMVITAVKTDLTTGNITQKSYHSV